MSTDGPTSPECLPTTLVEQLDVLGTPELRAARTYIDDRIEYYGTPIRERILAETDGQILAIEEHDLYVLVRKRPPDRDTPTVDPQFASQYYVTRELQLHGEKTLHWTFLGYVENVPIRDCDRCGGAVDERTDFCPHCGTTVSETRTGECND